MTLGERIYEYRNKINLSQEKLAEKIGVTRQTVSKWETDQSTPDFDKIGPLCDLFEITTDELIKGEKTTNNIKKEKNEETLNEYLQKRNKKKAIVLSISIFIYCIATFSLPYMLEVLRYEEAHAVMIWATLCTIATVIIVYFFVAYPEKKKKKNIKEDIDEIKTTIKELETLDNEEQENKTENKTEALIMDIIGMIFVTIYLLVSFITMAWHITWILWIVFVLVELIVKLIFNMKGEKDER